jgi:amino acid permease
LKIVTVILFIIVGIVVNAGFNTERRVIGFDNWMIPGAPFVGGFGGFARVFVTASFACEHLSAMLSIPLSKPSLLSWGDRKLGNYCW